MRCSKRASGSREVEAEQHTSWTHAARLEITWEVHDRSCRYHYARAHTTALFASYCLSGSRTIRRETFFAADPRDPFACELRELRPEDALGDLPSGITLALNIGPDFKADMDYVIDTSYLIKFLPYSHMLALM
ncbi:hypothetical protein KQX54_020625 [Cotesia glomerata]|uniref:Uncharacterized protein n=1 Tax=Cotesia glomerata TaxID=32391 RepID=A0AAV7I4T0_COTGL|nr:hypothetical protein KQX54_020625 [Cotesia glomerata]